MKIDFKLNLQNNKVCGLFFWIGEFSKKHRCGTNVGTRPAPDILPEGSEKPRCPSGIHPLSEFWILILIGFYFANTKKTFNKSEIF